MAERSEGGNRGPRRPSARSGGGRPPVSGPRAGGAPKPGGSPRRTGGLSLKRIGGDDFELVHPRCVREMELDYQEGIELWEAGDPESAQDALRYALQGCGDNLWVHVALGRIALDEWNDATLARGHFGYAFELAQRASSPGFTGRLPRQRVSNRPFHDAIEGLIRCYEALGQPGETTELRALSARLSGESRPGRGHPKGARGPEGGEGG